jgi:hypothetical protein
MLRALIWPLAFAAMDKAGAAAFAAWPHVKSVSDVATTAIVTDHAWPQNSDWIDGCERITMKPRIGPSISPATIFGEHYVALNRPLNRENLVFGGHHHDQRYL